jgi:sugar transferase (PEP-CTERM/EpsH1 system associated)
MQKMSACVLIRGVLIAFKPKGENHPMRILFILPYIPSLVRVRPYNLLRALARRGQEITLMCLQPPSDQGESLDDVRPLCKAVHIIPHPKSRTLLNAALALPTGFPLQAAYSRSSSFDDAAKAIQNGGAFEVAHIEHLRGAVLAESLVELPIVFDSVDSISLLFGKVLQDAPSLKSRLLAGLDLGRTRRFEGSLTRRFREVGVTSEADRGALVELGCAADRVTVIPNGVDLEYFQPMERPRLPNRLVFTGKMSYHANEAAAEDLVQKIMPLVWAQRPEAELYLVGKDPTEKVQALGQVKRVTVTGSVPDLRPYLAEAAVAVSTVRYGVGIQNKVLEAMAMRTPVVCSRQASSALRTVDGQDILIGDDPASIARHILNLLESDSRREAMGAAGRSYVESWHNWDGAAARFEDLYRRARS